MAFLDWVNRRIFTTVHGNNLVYNTCWEDPRLDRAALDFGPDDNVLVITSAGCNALDYALAGPNHVNAVDMNPRQNALLDLKMSAIRNLEFEDFFKMFGEGRYPGIKDVYEQKLRSTLPAWSKSFWDKRIKWFDNRRKTFYDRGTSGTIARMIRTYTNNVIRVRPHLDAILEANTLEEQKEIYETHLKKKFWSGLMKFTMNRDTTMSMLGVPKAQRRQIETQYQGGLVKFIQDCMESVFVELPMKDNYFWRVYMNGSYTRECCPEYLKAENFDKLKNGLVDRVSTHTDSVQGFLEKHDGTISRYILLDHMDWLSDQFFNLLESEWQAIIDRAAPNARLIWRSGGLRTDFIEEVQVNRNGEIQKISPLLKYNTELATELHVKDRVHTYGSFYIAELGA
ncbi:MAG: S-adenosylmethionine-diacylglycerol 3-amino-3-carboxypropyl transferase [Mariniblastus sp.]|jgi:S-adenosylmethionine-diacylglycerol 3-amino-3-carboxypropyl transferase